MSISINEKEKYNQENEKLTNRYNEVHDLVFSGDNYYKYKAQGGKDYEEIVKLQTEIGSKGDIVPLGDFEKKNEKYKKDNEKRIELRKSAIKLLEKLLGEEQNKKDSIQQAQENARQAIQQNADKLGNNIHDYINRINNSNSQEEVEKIRNEAMIKADNKENEEYNRQLPEREKATGYPEYHSKLFEDNDTFRNYKYGFVVSDNNELATPPDPEGLREIEELKKKVGDLKNLECDFNFSNKNKKTKDYNEEQLKLRKIIAEKIKNLLEKKGSQKTSPESKKNDQVEESKDSIGTFKQQVISEIWAVIHDQEATPILVDLSDDDEQWEKQIKNSNSEEEITEIKERLLLKIKTLRQAKTSKNELEDILRKSVSPGYFLNRSWEERKEDLEKIQSFNDKKCCQDEQVGIKNFKIESVKKLGFCIYGRENTKLIKARLTQFGLKVEELADTTQQKLQDLENWVKTPTRASDEYRGTIEEIIKLEEEIYVEVNEKGSQKKYDQLLEKSQNIKTAEEEKKLRQEMEEFITSDNVYYQKYQSQAQKLLASLKINSSTNSKSPNSAFSPWKVVVPITLLSGLLITGAIIIRSRRKSKKVD